MIEITVTTQKPTPTVDDCIPPESSAREGSSSPRPLSTLLSHRVHPDTDFQRIALPAHLRDTHGILTNENEDRAFQDYDDKW